jgi:nucleoside-diphosphate-sugar epimerase
MTKSVLVCGAGGHLVKRLVEEGCWVRGVDNKRHEYSPNVASEFMLGDLCDQQFVAKVVDREYDEVYQLAADMGGAGYIFSGDNDAAIMQNSATINLNMLDACHRKGVGRIFYSSSACIYPAYNQTDPNNPNCAEDSAYPAAPDSEYGWEKLFSERLYMAYRHNHEMDVHVARYHNIFGPEGTWMGGREKAPAAICRKIAMAAAEDEIEVWGDGYQTRSFLYIDECVEGTLRLMRSDVRGPLNIGSEEMVTINQMVDLVADIAGKKIHKRHIPGPLGVRGRTSDNRLIREVLDWSPSESLRAGLEKTYTWVSRQVEQTFGQIDKVA